MVWLIFATLSDLKSREIPNWLNFSLIIFALGFRFFYSLFSGSGEGIFFSVILSGFTIFLVLDFFSFSFKSKIQEVVKFSIYSIIFLLIGSLLIFNYLPFGDFNFLYQGILGMGVFFILGNLLYYARMFAGGDTKLMVSLGAVLPIFSNFNLNLELFFLFFLVFLLVGAFYGVLGSVVMSLRNWNKFRKGFGVYFSRGKKVFSIYSFFGILFLILGFWNKSFFYFGLFLFLFPFFYFFFKVVDEFCMVKKIEVSKLTPGDWLFKNVRVGKILIKSNWEGLGEEEISLLKKRGGRVFVRYGLQFSPVFLISFILLWVFLKFGSLDFLFKIFGF